MAVKTKPAPPPEQDDDASDELEAIRAELDRQERQRQEREARAPKGFDPASLFLLSMGWENLFEQAVSRSDWTFRCKGCGEIVVRTDRESHFKRHRRAITSKEVRVATTKTTTEKAAGKAAQNRQQREQKAARAEGEATEGDEAGVPEVEDVTGQEPATKVSKTAVAIDSAVEVLKAAGKQLTTDEIMADASMVDVNRGTLIVMLSKELRQKTPRVKRVSKGTYEAA